MHHHRIATLFHPLQLLAHPPLAHAHLLGRLALTQHPVPGPFQPFQLVPFLLAHLDSFHPSALRLSRGTFYLAQLGTFHLAATSSRLPPVGSKSRCPVLFTHDLSGFSFQPVDPRRLADGGFRVLVRRIEIAGGAVEKWESRGGISTGRWERWKTGLGFSTVSTGPAFPRLSGCGLGRSGCPSAV